MHIRTSRVTRNGKTYAYAQLVESRRRPSDGMPVHHVLATLGHLSDVAVSNLRAALEAARKGKRVVVARAPAIDTRPAKPTANLSYLDVAVLLELWRDWGLDVLLNELMPEGEATVPPASVVAALCIQRCVDPGSKLYAARWLPRTALPELLDLKPESYNNTRLHRVLDDLDSVTTGLMAKLPRRYIERDGGFVSLFTDVTDTWFIGHGPTLAERGKTKEGFVRRKISIVLLCNDNGYPLRWEVLGGCESDNVTIGNMLRSIAGLSWVGDAPVVCDRSMGNTAPIREMLATGLRFLTALVVTEFDSYAPSIPHDAFTHLEPQGESSSPQDVEEAARCAEKAGLEKVTDNLFVMDLGVIERDEGSRPRANPSAESATAAAMRLCRRIDEAVAQGRYSSYAAAGRAEGLRKGVLSKYRLLGRLSEQEQRDVLEGKAAGCSLAKLIEVASIESREQRSQAFAALVTASAAKRRRTPAATSNAQPSSTPSPEPPAPVRVRVAVYFNPERFVEQRLHARRLRKRIDTFVAELNASLQAPRSQHTKQSIAGAVDRRLRADSLLQTFKLNVAERSVDGRTRYHVRLELDEAKWARRARYDGFTVLVAHPELSQSANELCELYRAKDAVEKDFQSIKSVVQLRPVRHRDDGKVRAHVTLCMLSLLLERTLKHRLADHSTAVAALECLKTCHLNRYAGRDGSSAYIVTEPDAEQSAILRKLKLKHLIDDEAIADRITPRR